MRAFGSFITVIFLMALPWVAVEYLHLQTFFGIWVPYVAFFAFIGGFTIKVLVWAKSPVPFNITTTAGQQKSLKWIQSQSLENPSNLLSLLGRMFLEIFFFRSLFRNTKFAMTSQNRPGYAPDKSLWFGGLMFHWSFLYVVIRHLRFFVFPVPAFVSGLESLDRMLQIGLPVLYLTDVILVLSVTYLFLRRMVIAQVKYISLIADYFPLFVILAIALTGICMRYFTRIDVVGVKNLIMSLVHFKPFMAAGIGSLFFVHLFLISILFLYFPFSKLMHMGGIFLSPTRNMAGNSRKVRHINPWNYPVKVHSYEEYEEEFREVMKGTGLPVEKE